jgi:multisubunit Na+/H+ antiporter MnhE subunit
MKKFILGCFLQWVGFTLLWLLFVFQISRSELLVGISASALTVLALQTALRSEPLCFQPRFRWLVQAWRLPPLIMGDLRVLLKSLARRLARKPSRAAFQLGRFHAPGDDCRASAQRALAVLFLSIPPNSVILDVDHDCAEMLFHVLESAPVPKLARELEK